MGIFEKTPDREPFRKVAEFEGDPYLREVTSPVAPASFIARKADIKRVAQALNMRDNDLIEVARSAKGVFKKLKDVYKIPVAVHVIVSEGHTRQPAISLLTDKIKGRVLESDPSQMLWIKDMPDTERTRFASELDDLMSSLADYALENYKKSDFMWDIGSMRQYMWGKKQKEDSEKDSQPHLYLVDVDIYTNASQRDNMITTYMRNLAHSIDDYEGSLGVKLIEARKSLQRIIDAKVIDPDTLLKF